MGVADNKTYKDQYHFKDDFRIVGDDYPSINDEKKINSTIKENPYRSNVEIEGGEVVVKPDLTALFKAQGKKHSGGGMDVLLPPESFVFSNFKGIKISDKDKELFELKKGGNTPAEVLKENIKVKHYNTLISNLDDPYKDELAKKSSSMMLEKYIMTLGNIAYLQEEKKGFPEGLPEFSIGTAPVSDFTLDTQRDESKQYAKMGGTIMQRGGTNRRPPSPTATYDPITQLWYKSPSDIPSKTKGTVPAGYQPPYKPPMPKGYGTNPLLVEKINQYNAINESSYPTDRKGLLQSRTEFANVYPELVEYMFKQQGIKIPNSLANKNKKEYTREDLQQAFIDPNFQKQGEAIWGNRFATNEIKEFTSQADFDNFIKGRKIASSGMDEDGNVTTVYDDPKNPGQFYTPLLNIPQQQADVPNDYSYETPPPATPAPETTITPNPVTGQAQQGLDAPWRFTPWQKISQGFNWLNYAGIQRHMPYRSHYNATYADPALVNEQQAVGNARGIAGNQISSLNTLSPILRNAQAQAITGELLNTIPGLGLQAETTNASIKNQFRQYNNQIRNNESVVNMANDQQYYKEAVEGRKNFSNLRTFAANNAMNNVLRDVETNQKLAYNLLTLNNPAYGYDWKTGRFTRNKKNILDAQSDTKSDFYTQLAGKLMSKMDSGKQLTPEEVGFFKALSIGKIPFSPSAPSYPSYQAGGRVRNPYKY